MYLEYEKYFIIGGGLQFIQVVYLSIVKEFKIVIEGRQCDLRKTLHTNYTHVSYGFDTVSTIKGLLKCRVILEGSVVGKPLS